MSNQGWIGVDLDGTLAEYHGWKNEFHIGPPIKRMQDRVKGWLADGKDVRIFTARVNSEYGDRNVSDIVDAIQNWCSQHVGQSLPVTYKKDYAMIELWDDRAVQIIPNTGERADGNE